MGGVMSFRFFAIVVLLLLAAGCSDNGDDRCELDGVNLRVDDGVSNSPVTEVKVTMENDIDCCSCKGPTATATWSNETIGVSGTYTYRPKWDCHPVCVPDDDPQRTITVPLTFGENQITVDVTTPDRHETDSTSVYYDPVPPSTAEVEPNDSRTEAQPVSAPITITGTVNSDSDTADYYLFTGVDTPDYCVELSSVSPGGFADLCIHELDEEICEVTRNAAVSTQFDGPEQWYIVVQPWSTTDYHLYVDEAIDFRLGNLSIYGCP
jgi:hypothetical protein